MQQLRHFLTAVKYGHLGHAAEALNMTQSGLSRSIKNLEDSIGLPLLLRGARGVSASPYGLLLVPHAQAIVNERSRAIDTLREVRRGREGAIHLGITPNFNQHLIPDALAAFQEQWPNVVVNTSAQPLSQHIQSLQLAEIELLFGLFSPEPEPLPPGLKFEHLAESRSVIVCTRDHPLANKTVDPEELSRHSWALLEGEAFQQTFAHYFRSRNIMDPPHVILSNSMSLLSEVVRQMSLLTILPRHFVERAVHSGEFAHVDAEVPAGVTQIGLAYRENETLPATVKHLIDILKELTYKAAKTRAR